MTGSAFSIEGYEDLIEIGRGGFGVVYRARQPDFDRYVAIKVLSGIRDDHSRRRFDRERRSVGSLSGHPYIVTVYGSGFTADGSPFLVMEYLGGGSLADRLSRGRFEWRDAFDIGVKLSSAVQSAHEAGVLHCDIKPENVLVSNRGEPKLADFGIAVLQGMNATTNAALTPVHAAPEVLGGKTAAPAADVYSLTSTIYALVAGSPAFLRETDESILPVIARVATDPVPDLRVRGLPDAAWIVLERGMVKDPALRTPSAAALGEQFAAARAPAAGAGSVRIDPEQTIVAGAVGVAAPPVPSAPPPAPPRVAAHAPTQPPPPSPPTQTPRPPPLPPPPSRSGRTMALLVATAVVVVIGIGAAIALVATRGSDDDGDPAATTSAPGSSTAPATPEEAARAFATEVQTVLEESAKGRGQVGPLVSGVLNGCEIPPADASRQIRQVIDNRTDILTQLGALPAAPDAEAEGYLALFRDALQSSIEADIQYKSWMDFLNTEGCPGGRAPTNAAFSAAQAADANSTSLKSQFVNAYNPVATRFGLRTWTEGEF